MKYGLVILTVVGSLITTGTALGSVNEKVLRQNLHKSQSVVSWWNGKGKEHLRLHKNYCWQVQYYKLRVRCMYARKNLAAHKQRIARINNYFDPPVIDAIRRVFGSYADQAIRVADCETGGTFSVYASNGQYLGLFQMGDYARGRYGHSYTAIGQARAAYNYFADAGYDWSPWECKPW